MWGTGCEGGVFVSGGFFFGVKWGGGGEGEMCFWAWGD